MTVVEWGHGLAEGLAEEYLEVLITGESTRTVTLEPHGERGRASRSERHHSGRTRAPCARTTPPPGGERCRD